MDYFYSALDSRLAVMQVRLKLKGCCAISLLQHHTPAMEGGKVPHLARWSPYRFSVRIHDAPYTLWNCKLLEQSSS